MKFSTTVSRINNFDPVFRENYPMKLADIWCSCSQHQRGGLHGAVFRKSNMIQENRQLAQYLTPLRPIKDIRLAERIIHLLAIAVPRKDIRGRIEKEGVNEGEMTAFRFIMNGVVSKHSKFLLKSELWNNVNVNWPYYTEEEKKQAKRNKEMVTTPSPPKDRSTSSSSENGKTPNLMRVGSSAEISPPQKRKASTDLNTDSIKKPISARSIYNPLEENTVFSPPKDRSVSSSSESGKTPNSMRAHSSAETSAPQENEENYVYIKVLEWYRPKKEATRRPRHYRSGLRALHRGRRPRQRGSVAQPEQHYLSASRAAEQGRGGARRQALLPDHMPGEEVPSARQQFEGGDRADAFQGARISDGRARPARHVLQCESSRGLRKLSARAVRVLVAARGAAQPGARRHRHDLRESVGAVVILVEQVEDQSGVHRPHDKIKR
ncbi:unnamed protein product [Trichogramma brassicae]|uniref:RNA polymerase II elongation factor ELL N-terminal domain-containing protein n=1 Tax=Trichogramma brassicae TaxID=86971 RepID=A0A6H5ITV2_9HYME|nr:unnamed protein product [Trichogramma brassicae]